jgi:Formin Homology 2 Domain.
LTTWQGQLNELEVQHESALSSYKELLADYGEDPATMQPEEFFGVIAKFCTSVEVEKFLLNSDHFFVP